MQLEKKEYLEKIEELKKKQEDVIKKINTVLELESIDVLDFSDEEIKNNEIEYLGFSITCHPAKIFKKYEKLFSKYYTPDRIIPKYNEETGELQINDLCEGIKCETKINEKTRKLYIDRKTGKNIYVYGVVSNLNEYETKQGQKKIIFDLEYNGEKIRVGTLPWLWNNIDEKDRKQIKDGQMGLFQISIENDLYNGDKYLYNYVLYKYHIFDFIYIKNNKILIDVSKKDSTYIENIKKELTKFKEECYNNYYPIKYIVGLKYDNKIKALPVEYWVEDKIKILTHLRNKGLY